MTDVMQRGLDWGMVGYRLGMITAIFSGVE